MVCNAERAWQGSGSGDAPIDAAVGWPGGWAGLGCTGLQEPGYVWSLQRAALMSRWEEMVCAWTGSYACWHQRCFFLAPELRSSLPWQVPASGGRGADVCTTSARIAWLMCPPHTSCRDVALNQACPSAVTVLWVQPSCPVGPSLLPAVHQPHPLQALLCDRAPVAQDHAPEPPCAYLGEPRPAPPRACGVG